MKTLKNLVAAALDLVSMLVIIAIVALLFVCVPARAQFQPNNIQSICDSGTNYLAANTTLTNSYTSTGATNSTGPVGRVDCGRGKEVGIVYEFKQDIAGVTNNFGFVWAKGITQGASSNYATDSVTNWIAGNGTTTVRLVTNVTVNGVSDYYLIAILNTNASTTRMTNILVKAHVK